ncbi:hypothetical protein G210_0512 [Candida maltosa Xu316]|uniref:Uncharacterized protein n=1 Tax=Candida maltosa (strain Xu316) TaxID=1245528 RepID=M3HN01_CANMX|nr:hypothetical protein G210_0512 [Candida maltosa Xu316]
MNQVMLFSVTTFHFLIVCVFVGVAVGIVNGVNLSIISVLLHGPTDELDQEEKKKDNVFVKKSNFGKMKLGKSDNLTGRDWRKEFTESYREKQKGNGGGVVDLGAGDGILIPDLLPSITKSRIQKKIQEQRRLSERKVAESQYEQSSGNPTIEELADEEEVYQGEPSSIEVIGLEDDGYAYTGGLRNRVEKDKKVEYSNTKLATGRGYDEGKNVRFVNNEEQEVQKEVDDGPEVSEEQPVQEEVEDSSNTDEGVLSNIPEEDEEEDGETEEEIFTRGDSLTEDTTVL